MMSKLTSMLPLANAKAMISWLSRIRWLLIFMFVGSALYACGVWDMLNEVSERESSNGLLWSATSSSLLARYQTKHSSNQHLSGVGDGGTFRQNRSSLASLTSLIAFYRHGASSDINSVHANDQSFFYSASLYYMEKHAETNSIKQRARRRLFKHRQQWRRMVALTQRDISKYLPLQSSSFTILDNHTTTFNTTGNSETTRAFGDDRQKLRLSRIDNAAVYKQTADVNNVVDFGEENQQHAFFATSSADNILQDAAKASDPKNFMQLLVQTDHSMQNGIYDSGGYSPTATTTAPLLPLTLSLQPTPSSDITSSYYFTSTIAVATHPTIREPHNYSSDRSTTTTPKTFYQMDNNNFSHYVEIDAVDSKLSAENDDDSSSYDTDADFQSAMPPRNIASNEWWLHPMQLSSLVNVSDFSFMQFVVSPQCPLQLQDSHSTAASSTTSGSDAIVHGAPMHAEGLIATAHAETFATAVRPNCKGTSVASDTFSTGSRRVLILIKTARAHFERRMVIRQTWASHPQLIVRFLMGQPSPDDVLPLTRNEFGSNSNATTLNESMLPWYMQFYERLSTYDNGSNVLRSDAVNYNNSMTKLHALVRQNITSIAGKSRPNGSSSSFSDDDAGCVTVACNITRESKLYRDVLLTDFVDNYYNNTFKTLSGIHWAVQSCRLGSVEYVLVSDDDMWLNPYNFLMYLEKATLNGTISADRDLYMGYLFPNSKPMRMRWSKWYVPVSVYKFSRYPPYITASAILMSRSTLIKFAEASLHTQYFLYDDIFLAILARQLGINATHNPLFSSFNRVDVHDDPAVFSQLIVSHGYGQPSALLHAWNTTVCQRLFAPVRGTSNSVMPIAATALHVHRSRPALQKHPSLWQWIFGRSSRNIIKSNSNNNTSSVGRRLMLNKTRTSTVMPVFDPTRLKLAAS